MTKDNLNLLLWLSPKLSFKKIRSYDNGNSIYTTLQKTKTKLGNYVCVWCGVCIGICMVWCEDRSMWGRVGARMGQGFGLGRFEAGASKVGLFLSAFGWYPAPTFYSADHWGFACVCNTMIYHFGWPCAFGGLVERVFSVLAKGPHQGTFGGFG